MSDDVVAGADAATEDAATEDAATEPARLDPTEPEFVKKVLYSRWQEPPPSQLTTRRIELRRLADSMRLIIERLVATAAPTEEIIEAADELARVALRFDRLQVGKDHEGFAEAANIGGDRFALFEHSPFIGRANPLAPPLQLQEIDGNVHGRGFFGSAYEGPPGCVHGGFVAAAFDEVLGAAQSMAGNPGMTGTLTVRYRSPTPLHTELHFTGAITKIEGRKIFTEGQLFAGDRLCAEAEGLFISVDLARFAVLRQEQEERDQDQGRATPPRRLE